MLDESPRRRLLNMVRPSCFLLAVLQQGIVRHVQAEVAVTVDPNSYLDMPFSCVSPPMTLTQMEEIFQWCHQCVGVYRKDWARGAKYMDQPYRFWFHREEDAVMFKLRWC